MIQNHGNGKQTTRFSLLVARKMVESTNSPCCSRLSKKKRRQSEAFCFFLLIVCVVVGALLVIIAVSKNITDKSFEQCGPQFKTFSVSLNGAEKDKDGGYTKNGVYYTKEKTFQENGTIYGCPCLVKTCVYKCCPFDEVFEYNYEVENHICVKPKVMPSKSFKVSQLRVSQNSWWADNEAIDKHFHIVVQDVCELQQQQKIGIHPDNELNDTVELQKNGIIIINEEQINQSMYCLEREVSDNKRIVTYTCGKDQSQPGINTIIVISLAVSIFFILATFLVYVLLLDLKYFIDKCLMCQMTCLLVLYLLILRMEIMDREIKGDHYIYYLYTAVILQFSFLGNFFWLNAMCFDIWWVFSGGFRITGGNAGNRKLLLYSIYAFGGPLLITALTTFISISTSIDDFYLRPKISSNTCWCTSRPERMLVMVLPAGVLVSLNIMMFVFTLLHLRADLQEFSPSLDSQRHNSENRDRYVMVLTLFITMGVAWGLEVLSHFSEKENVWLFSDVINSLQGLFIFLIKVCRKRTLKTLRDRVRNGRQRDSACTFSNSTRSSISTRWSVGQNVSLKTSSATTCRL